MERERKCSPKAIYLYCIHGQSDNRIYVNVLPFYEQFDLLKPDNESAHGINDFYSKEKGLKKGKRAFVSNIT